MALRFINAEKQMQDMVVFPAFNISIGKGEVAAVHTNVNIREILIDLLLGKTNLSQGEIRFHSEGAKAQDQSGFLFLHDGLYERLTVNEMLVYTKRLYTSKILIETAVHMMQLADLKRNKINTLSFSKRKRVQMACLFIQNPAIYILEEPDQNLDLESKRIYLLLLDHLRKLNKTVLIITGSMESAVAAADAAYKLNDSGLREIQIGTHDDQLDGEGAEQDELKEVAEVKPISLEKIPSKINDKIVLFHPLEIDYIESQDGQSFLHVKDEVFPCAFTLQQLEERLFPFGFFRCHRSYLVNLQKVREVMTWTRNSYSLILENKEKTTIPLSKSKMSELKGLIGI